MAFAWSCVELVGNYIAVLLSDGRHVHSFRQVLSDQTVEVLVGTALPGVVGRGEVELELSGLFDLFIGMELGAIVGGDGAKWSTVFFHEVDRAPGSFGSGACSQFADEHESGFAFHDADDAMLAGMADDGVDFPVTFLGALVCCQRAVADGAFAC